MKLDGHMLYEYYEVAKDDPVLVCVQAVNVQLDQVLVNSSPSLKVKQIRVITVIRSSMLSLH